MPRPAVGLWLTTLIWVAVTGGLWTMHAYQLEHGREIALKTVPIDPRDVLRGDYVVLRYEVSSVERSDDDTRPRGFQQGRVVFVSLREVDGEWEAVDVDLRAPRDGLFLRGRITSITPQRLEVAYGIESFFVPEGEGQRYEAARNRDRLWAIVSVSPQGIARLKRLEIR